jgi:hypothetical protein
MVSHQHITKGTTVALVVGAIAAPAASAGPIADSTAAQQHQTQVVYPRVVGSVTGSHPFGPNRPLPAAGQYVPRAAGQPTGAVPIAANPPSSSTHSPQDKQLVPKSPTPAPVTPGPTIVQVSNPSGGFDWADAGIGAAGGLVLSVLGLGGSLALHRRSRKPTLRPGESAVATS